MRVIVYGSLRRKQGNSHWMTNATWLGDYVLEGYELYDLGHYPAVVPGEGRGSIAKCIALPRRSWRSWMS